MVEVEAECWMCTACGWIYDPAIGDPEHGVAAGTPWNQVPGEWVCPECGAPRDEFVKIDF